jgi:7,8-dihydro-6-hydroxymethylpterin-pyrophosphokinase
MVAMYFERIPKPRKPHRAFTLERLTAIALALAFTGAGAAIAILARVH